MDPHSGWEYECVPTLQQLVCYQLRWLPQIKSALHQELHSFCHLDTFPSLIVGIGAHPSSDGWFIQECGRCENPRFSTGTHIVRPLSSLRPDQPLIWVTLPNMRPGISCYDKVKFNGVQYSVSE